MTLEGKRYAILSFDTESNIGSWTQEYSSIDLAMPKLLNLLDSKKIRATFVWEGMAALHNPGMVKETFSRGHECGCHTLMHETVGKAGYSIPGDRAVLPSEFESRLRENKRIIWELTGREPVSFRAPRLWTDAGTLHALESNGFLHDSSYPIASDDDPFFPYFPSSEDLSKAGNSSVLQLPVTYLTKTMLKDADPTLKFFAEEMTGEQVNLGQWPVLRLYGGDTFYNFFELFAQAQEKQRGFSLVSIYQHPWEYIPVPGILDCPEGTTHLRRTLYENSGDFTLNALSEFIDRMKGAGYEFLTMEQAGSMWKEAFYI